MSKKKSKSNKNKSSNIFISIKNSFRNDKLKSALGLTIVGISLFLTIAFVSFFYSGAADRSKLDISFWDFFSNPDIIVTNFAGKLGAFFADLFINDWFGIASFSIIIFSFLIGMRLLGAKILPLKKTFVHASLITVWLSILLGFLFINSIDYKYIALGGAHGFYVSKWLISILGWIGTLLTLVLILLIYLVVNFNFLSLKKSFDIFFSKFKKKTVLEDAKDDSNDIKNTIDINDSDDDSLINIDVEKEETENKKDDDFSIDYSYSTSEDENGEILEIDSGTSDDDELNFDIEKNVDEEEVNKNTMPQGDYDPTLDLSSYKLPTFDLLDAHDSLQSEVTEQELIDNKNQIVQTLNDYKIQIKSIKATVGPTITLYEIIPMAGVRISKIKNLEDDIALSLAALGIRIIAPIPGKGTVGIEVPNSEPQIVSMRSIISSKKFQSSKFDLAIAIGKTISNETFVFDLAKAPHLLVAGATGQGKSVGLNAIITSLLYKKHPSQLKFVLIDPKKVELNIYSKIERHFLAKLPDEEEAIITDVDKVVNTLNSLTIEMDDRYELFKKANTRNIKEYNHKFVKRQLNPEKGHRFLPYIVVVIDEFADLIMTAGKEVELPIARIAQMARAVGIHMIIATQRPSTNIITGVIKANFPTRIAFKVASMIDSRTILDSPGANQLIGRGDMLISQGSDLVRVQCAFVDTPEVEKINDYIGEQRGYPSALLLPEYVGESSTQEPGDVDLSKKDSLFEDAARIVVANQSGSTSLIQRRFSIGYNRAGRIIDQLEAAGIVGPFEGSKARQVLVADELQLERMLENI